MHSEVKPHNSGTQERIPKFKWLTPVVTTHKTLKFCINHARDIPLQSIYIQKFCKNLVFEAHFDRLFNAILVQ